METAKLGFAAGLTLIALVIGMTTYRQDQEPPAFPDPPQQSRPWAPPETKLPRFLVRAAERLYEQGVADPRGCEYRDVEIKEPSLGLQSLKTRAFVIPEREGDARRFGVGWDGIVYPLANVGAPADLAADVRAMAEHARAARELAESTTGRRRFGRYPTVGGSTVEIATPQHVVTLLRLGRVDLAESLFAALTGWSPDGPWPDLTDYGISYLTLANDWATLQYVRGVDAHAEGEDPAALDIFRRLVRFRDAVEAQAQAMGFPKPQGFRVDRGPSYFPDLWQLDVLHADQERRAKEPKRGPVPGRGADPGARVAALIRDFDQIAARQWSSPGSAHPGGARVVREVVAMGDVAVEPLLEALVSDTRLTRSVSMGRGFGLDRYVHPTHDAIVTALDALMKTRILDREDLRRPDPESRRRLAAAYRAFWEANRNVSLPERYFRELADDRAEPGRWLGAALALTSPEPDAFGRPRYVAPDQPPLPMLGEPLRAGRAPSIMQLLIHRIESQAGPLGSSSDLEQACQMAEALARWDPPAAGPTVRLLMDRCRAMLAPDRNRPDYDPTRSRLATYLARFTLLRARHSDAAALDEYAAWAAGVRPIDLGDPGFVALEPLWAFPERPALAEVARRLFTDPESPWLPLVTRRVRSIELLLTSPMLRVPAFRDAVLATLQDRTPIGDIERPRNDPERAWRTLRNGSGLFFVPMLADLVDVSAVLVETIRACDSAAYSLAQLEGTPRFELYWSEDRRDAAIAELSEFLRRYGGNFTSEAPPGVRDFPHTVAHLAFPTLDRPATADDVASGRAIFALADEGGEVRVRPMPAHPLRARWTTLEDTPIVQQSGDGTRRIAYDRDGWVWQAEEVRKGDAWERWYGFVGANTVARAPADAIEFPEESYLWGSLSSALDARVQLDETPAAGFAVGQPVRITVHIRNRRGVDVTAPTEFLRRSPDGVVALRRGVALRLRRSDLMPEMEWPSFERQTPPEWTDVPARRAEHFAPNDATRPLGPAEAFEAFAINLSEWFDLSKPGQYQLHLEFADDSGLGAGQSNTISFRVGDTEGDGTH